MSLGTVLTHYPSGPLHSCSRFLSWKDSGCHENKHLPFLLHCCSSGFETGELKMGVMTDNYECQDLSGDFYDWRPMCLMIWKHLSFPLLRTYVSCATHCPNSAQGRDAKVRKVWVLLPGFCAQRCSRDIPTSYLCSSSQTAGLVEIVKLKLLDKFKAFTEVRALETCATPLTCNCPDAVVHPI